MTAFVLPEPVPDPLFAIAAEAQAAGSEAINGSVGIFMDEEGKPFMLPSVKRAILDLREHLPDFNYSYPPLTGLPDFRSGVHSLLFGDRAKGHVASIAATGGTGALAINLRLMKMVLGEERPSILLPVPAWGNHHRVCASAGFDVVDVPYLENARVTVDALIAIVKSRKKPCGLLWQLGCHNPTGLDASEHHMRSLLDALRNSGCVLLLDSAYQGFKQEPEHDAASISACVTAGIRTLVSWSASKNHSIYGLRTGLAAVVAESEREQSKIEGLYGNIIRGLHSAAPTFGQAIVARTQQAYGSEWRSDLRFARELLLKKRTLLMAHLPESFRHALSGHGMFAMLPLNAKQVISLKKQKVFLTLDGRINIAGIPERRIEELCARITGVL